jgi:hypothetical protein
VGPAVGRNIIFDDAMLGSLSSTFRFWASLTVAALYALCVLTPHAALALGNTAAHCLTDDHPAAHVHAAQKHTHPDGPTHHHPDTAAHDDSENAAFPSHSGGDDKNHNGACCGLFCISAIAFEPGVILPVPSSCAAGRADRADALNGRCPGRLNRPPIA